MKGHFLTVVRGNVLALSCKRIVAFPYSLLSGIDVCQGHYLPNTYKINTLWKKIVAADKRYCPKVYKRSDLEILTCYQRLDQAPPIDTQSWRPIVAGKWLPDDFSRKTPAFAQKAEEKSFYKLSFGYFASQKVAWIPTKGSRSNWSTSALTF